MPLWTKLYRPGTSILVAEKPALPSGVGANHETFMPTGFVKATSVRLATNRLAAGEVSAPTAATAPGGGEPAPGASGWNGMPEGDIPPPCAIAPPIGGMACCPPARMMPDGPDGLNWPLTGISSSGTLRASISLAASSPEG